MGLYDKMRYAANERDKRRKEVKNISSKERLTQIIAKRTLAAAIGSLERFENQFGYLWGHNEKNKTPEQRKFLSVWKKVREDILDFAHDQIEFTEKDLLEYDINWNRPRTEIQGEFWNGENNVYEE